MNSCKLLLLHAEHSYVSNTLIITCSTTDKKYVWYFSHFLPAPLHVVGDVDEDDVLELLREVVDGVEEVILVQLFHSQHVFPEIEVVSSTAVNSYVGHLFRVLSNLGR